MSSFSVVDQPGTFRPMIRLALPVFLEESVTLMVGWTDWWLTGHFLKTDAHKAAMNLMGYTMWLLPSLFAMLAIGTTAIVARYVGQRDMSTANRAANQAFVLGIALASVLLLIAALGARQFVIALQLTGDAAQFATEYLQIIVWIIPFVMIEQIGAASLRGAGDTVSGFAAKSIVVIINIAISLCLVTGWGPFPEMGWKGLAIGTAIGHGVGGSLLLAIVLCGRAGIRWQPSRMRPDWLMMKKIIKIGAPGGFDIATVLGSQLVFLAVVNRLGTTPAAAHGLAVQVEAMAYMPGSAFQVAAATMAGQYLGANLPDQATKSVLACGAVGLTFMTTAGVFLYFFGHWMTLFFTGDSSGEVTMMANHLLKIIALGMPCLAVVMILNGALRGAGDTVYPMAFSAIGFLCVRIPLAVFLAWDSLTIPGTDISIECMGLGVVGAWYAMVSDLLVRSIFVSARFFHGGWKNVQI
jgi:putative MATE family efflux protein